MAVKLSKGKVNERHDVGWDAFKHQGVRIG